METRRSWWDLPLDTVLTCRCHQHLHKKELGAKQTKTTTYFTPSRTSLLQKCARNFQHVPHILTSRSEPGVPIGTPIGVR